MKNKKSIRIIICGLIVYVLLLIVLTAVESKAPGSSIHSIWDALWYSIITITTVGYGDMAPVTPFGRVLGLVFALCSIGLLTALISLGVSLIGGEAPRFRLRHARSRNWYWFSVENADSTALAKAIQQEDPDSLVVFPRGDGNPGKEPGVLRTDADPAELLRTREKPDGLSLFYAGEDRWHNAAAAVGAGDLGVPVYSLTDCAADNLPENVQFFSPSEVLSRSYWKKHPIGEQERCVIFIGCEETGSALLTRALLTNIFEKTHVLEYHVFGSAQGFASLHPEIVAALAPGHPYEDSLIFHDEAWTAAPDLLARADRIILCADTDPENLMIHSQLRQWFAVPGKVHVRLFAEVPGVDSFGSREDSLTPEFVMKDAVNHMAILINDLYNENSDHPVAWRDLGEFFRQSNIAAADHLPVKVRWLLGEDVRDITPEQCQQAYDVFCGLDPAQREICREMEHRRWLRFYQMYNWRLADKRNDALRLHVSMVPYDRLSEAEQKKDDYAWELLGSIAERRSGREGV